MSSPYGNRGGSSRSTSMTTESGACPCSRGSTRRGFRAPIAPSTRSRSARRSSTRSCGVRRPSVRGEMRTVPARERSDARRPRSRDRLRPVAPLMPCIRQRHALCALVGAMVEECRSPHRERVDRVANHFTPRALEQVGQISDQSVRLGIDLHGGQSPVAPGTARRFCAAHRPGSAPLTGRERGPCRPTRAVRTIVSVSITEARYPRNTFLPRPRVESSSRSHGGPDGEDRSCEGRVRFRRCRRCWRADPWWHGRVRFRRGRAVPACADQCWDG